MTRHTERTENYRGYNISLVWDTDAPNPREEWDNVGRMEFSQGYKKPMGDETYASIYDRILNLALDHASPKEAQLIHNWDEMGERLAQGGSKAMEKIMHDTVAKILREHYVIMGLDHYSTNEITATSLGSAHASSIPSLDGIIYCTKERAQKEWGVPNMTDEEAREAAERYLNGEVNDYCAYLMDEVVGYVVEDLEGNEIDSCWGFFPDRHYAEGKDRYSYVMDEARAVVDREIEHQQKLETDLCRNI